jgi:hypothetical protein
VSPVELQQSIQRFVGEFIDRVTQACTVVQKADPSHEQLVLQRLLLYGSSALDIASGPQPEVNVLDMLVFVTLSRQSLEMYWIPQVLGDNGQGVVAAFTDSERQLWSISDRIMSAEQQDELKLVIRSWREIHPQQVRVEWVRFNDFSSRAGEVAQEHARAARGLLGSVRSAGQTADQALMLAERGMFVANRLPFLMRLQARLGVQETIDDSLNKLQNVQSLVAAAPKLREVILETAKLTNNAQAAAHESRLLYDRIEPLLLSLKVIEGDPERPPTVTWAQVREVLESSNRLTDRSLSLAQEVHWLVERDAAGAAKEVSAGVDRIMRRAVGYLLLLGAAWSLFFWGGYFLAKRAVAHPPGTGSTWTSTRLRRRSHSPSNSR